MAPSDADLPDLILIVTDQERAPPVYESEAVRRWRERALPARRWFREHGVSFESHHVGATACVPSRATLWTGHYPDVHGVSQTTGIGKHEDDPRIRWLQADALPTLGHYLQHAGYDVLYDGKWHVSAADLRDPASGDPLATNTEAGEVRQDAVARYRQADPLAAFGFHGWVGPEPHGPQVADSGLVRDPLLAERMVRLLAERNARRRAGEAAAARPMCLLVNFVNPHDIVFWPGWAWRGSPLSEDPLDPPAEGPPPTADETLDDKPATQRAYRDVYPAMLGPAAAMRAAYDDHGEAYRATYLRLHLEVDRQIDRVLQEALRGPRADHTLFLLTSDHGDLLGAHGGQHQKWLSLYEEAIHVPFLVAHTGALGPQGVQVHQPTSHVDLLPTLMSLAGLDQARAAEALASTHRARPAPVGVDLWPLIRGEAPEEPARALYVTTRDNIGEGDDARPMAQRLPGMPPREDVIPIADVATSLEAVIARAGPEGHRVKLVRTFDDPAYWTEPGVRRLAERAPGIERYREEPVPDAFELYDLDTDPLERHNLADDPAHRELRRALELRLAEVRSQVIPDR